MTVPGEAAHLLHMMSVMLGAKALQDRDLEFARSIVGQHRRRPAMVPSPKQMTWMRRLVDDFLAATLGDDEPLATPTRDER